MRESVASSIRRKIHRVNHQRYTAPSSPLNPASSGNLGLGGENPTENIPPADVDTMSAGDVISSPDFDGLFRRLLASGVQRFAIEAHLVANDPDNLHQGKEKWRCWQEGRWPEPEQNPPATLFEDAMEGVTAPPRPPCPDINIIPKHAVDFTQNIRFMLERGYEEEAASYSSKPIIPRET